MGNYGQKVLTKTLSPIIYYTGVHNLTKPFFSGRGHILMMHRVILPVKKTRIHNHLSLEISPEHLERIIEFFLKKRYDFISLDALADWMHYNIKTNRKFVAFTFDDGYKDNLEYALPVLQKHKVPFTIYITNSFPEKKAILWWYLLEDLLIRTPNIKYLFPSGMVDVRCYSYSQKERAFSIIRNHLMKLNYENIQDELNKFFSNFGFQVSDYASNLCLSWDNINSLVADPLFSIGSHTLNHHNLLNLSDKQAYAEVSESKAIIENKIQRTVQHFSYPLGKFGKREVEIVKKCNFTTATTTQTGNISLNHSDNLHSLPRIQVNSLTTEKVLKLQINGFYPALLHFLPLEK
jgi:peptidoglycan/xylan/chitin deacetylase (PgdA/CDA1 family)